MRIAEASLLCLVILGCRSSSGPRSGNTPEEMFRYVVMDPIPASVTKLQGVGDTWQGYSLHLRFAASSADIDALIAQGFNPISWQSVASRFTLPPDYDRFNPRWYPAAIPVKECYEMGNVKNTWTGQGTHYLAIDRGTGTVYFYGVGA